MVWRFLTHYGMNKAPKLIDELATQVVQFDPHSASRAQVSLLEDELDTLGRRLAEAEIEVRREHQETLELKRSYDLHLGAAEILEKRLAEATDAGARTELEASLAKVVGKLEDIRPDIEREEQEDREVEVWRSELRTTYEQFAQKVKTAHQDLSGARRKMEMATLQKERESVRERRALEAAGIPVALSTVNVALDAMNRETARVRAETEAMKIKAEVLAAGRIEGDRHATAALEEARRAGSPSAGSVHDRLKALKHEPVRRLSSVA